MDEAPVRPGDVRLRIDAVRHSFGALRVLDGVDLSLSEGEVVVLLGPSGSGKSTLLNIVAGLCAPSSGRVWQRAGSRIAMVFQDATLLPWRTVTGNVALALEAAAVPDREGRVASALALVGLSQFAGALPKELSGGMAQRVNLARALVTGPDVLLMDEPLSGLDEPTRDDLLNELIALWKGRRFTCLYVTHSPTEALRLGNRIVVLSGRPARVAGEIRIDVAHGDRQDDAPAMVAARAQLRRLVRDGQVDLDRAG